MQVPKNIIKSSLGLMLLLLTSCSDTKFGGTGNALDRTGANDAVIAKKFDVASFNSGSLNLNDGKVSQEITLSKIWDNGSVVSKQVDRPIQTVLAKQGSSPMQLRETFKQSETGGVLDLLLVIDSSGSMDDDQEHVKDNLPSLIDEIDNSDWRIAIVSTDHNKPCNRGIINKSDVNRIQDFKDKISAIGTKESGYEKGIFMAQQGLKCASPSSWIRPKSSIAVLIVSDELNCGNERQCEGKPSLGANLKIVATTVLNRNLGTDFRVYGIIPPGGGTNPDMNYQQVIVDTNGIWSDINQIRSLPKANRPAKYSEVLGKISDDLKDLLKANFSLKSEPQPSTVIVKVNGSVVPSSNYDVVENILSFKFEHLPPTNAAIEIDYMSKDTKKKIFSLGVAPVPGSVKVLVQGNPFPAAGYVVEGSNLIFNNFPPEFADIKVEFRDSTVSLQTKFELPSEASTSGVKVLVGEEEKSNFTIEPSNGKNHVVFEDQMSDGKDITLKYKIDRGPKLSYPITLSGANPGDYELRDLEDKVIDMTMDHSTKTIIIDASEFVENKKLVFSHTSDESKLIKLELPWAINLSTLNVSPEIPSCDYVKKAVISGVNLTIECDREVGVEYKVSFESVKKFLREFDMSSVTRPDIGSWTVKLDGKTVNFKREGSMIVLVGDIPKTAKELEIVYNPFGD